MKVCISVDKNMKNHINIRQDTYYIYLHLLLCSNMHTHNIVCNMMNVVDAHNLDICSVLLIIE